LSDFFLLKKYQSIIISEICVIYTQSTYAIDIHEKDVIIYILLYYNAIYRISLT